VVTPFYDTADHLAECIESVLAQTLGDFEYILADNRSTDGSRAIAEAYAATDCRVRFVAFDEHLPQLANYNRALGLMHPAARYCKVAQADDLLMPRCLEEMVALAETDETIGLVGAYTVRQDQVALDALDFRERVVEGIEIVRRFLLGGRYVLGNPTTCLYRAERVRECQGFFPTDLMTGDTHAALRLLRRGRFGFVHQVLTVCRRRPGSISSDWPDFGSGPVGLRVALELHGDLLAPDVLARQRRRWARVHHRVLAKGALTGRPPAFWHFHRHELAAAGLRIERGGVALATLGLVGAALLNPGQSAQRVARWIRRRTRPRP
jgi:glycosyltransferase involved in cell wall biosynthesis